MYVEFVLRAVFTTSLWLFTQVFPRLAHHSLGFISVCLLVSLTLVSLSWFMFCSWFRLSVSVCLSVCLSPPSPSPISPSSLSRSQSQSVCSTVCLCLPAPLSLSPSSVSVLLSRSQSLSVCSAVCLSVYPPPPPLCLSFCLALILALSLSVSVSQHLSLSLFCLESVCLFITLSVSPALCCSGFPFTESL